MAYRLTLEEEMQERQQKDDPSILNLSNASSYDNVIQHLCTIACPDGEMNLYSLLYDCNIILCDVYKALRNGETTIDAEIARFAQYLIAQMRKDAFLFEGHPFGSEYQIIQERLTSFYYLVDYLPKNSVRHSINRQGEASPYWNGRPMSDSMRRFFNLEDCYEAILAHKLGREELDAIEVEA
jgi:hypothetical protein